MPVASVMAEQAKSLDEPGAPIAKDAIDPDLIRLKRNRPKIGVITAAGLVFLCAFFVIRLNPDRRFAGAAGDPARVTVADVLGGNVALDKLVAIEAQPLMSQAIRSTTSKGSLGLRVVPTRGTGERLWLVVSGDGWEVPAPGTYVGRLRRLGDLPFAPSVAAYSTEHPRPVFAAAAAVRAGFAANKVATVTGDQVTLADGDRVAFDLVDPSAAVLVCTLNERLPTAGAWKTALEQAGIATGAPQLGTDQVRFELSLPGAVATVTTKLEAAHLWAARVDPVTRHYETTWGALRGSAPTGFSVGSGASGSTIPDTQLDLVGLYVARAIPGDAYAVLTNERPEDYWYVLPVTIVLAAIGLLFAWALVRAVKRDLLPTRA